MFKELLLSRLAAPDCNAGVMFDDIKSKLWPSELYALKCVMEAIGTHGLQLVVFNQQKDAYGYEVCKVIEWEGMEQLALKDDEK